MKPFQVMVALKIFEGRHFDHTTILSNMYIPLVIYVQRSSRSSRSSEEFMTHAVHTQLCKLLFINLCRFILSELV